MSTGVPNDGEASRSQQRSDLVAFEVESSGHFLVPLRSLERFRTPRGGSSTTEVARCWGWTLPLVQWNTFHSSQIGTRIQLAPDVVATLNADHFDAEFDAP